MPVHSATPFPVHAGSIGETLVDAARVPWWLAEIAYARHARLMRENAVGEPPTISEIERAGGFDPGWLLDALMGGEGHGVALSRFMRAHARRLTGVRSDASPFPVHGDRVDDGTGIEPGAIPRYLAELAHARFLDVWSARGIVALPDLDHVAREGGFEPLALLDLLAGGDGSGGAFQAMQSSAARDLRKMFRGQSLDVEVVRT